ncbi:MAG TPA: alpha/beta hydrolase [Chryseolinea sp.]
MSGTNKKLLLAYPRIRNGVRIMLMTFTILLILVGLLFVYSPGKPAPVVDEHGKVVKNSISEKLWVTIGNVRQGMFIRGSNKNNPVLLFLHGGPGMPTYFLNDGYPTGLEKHFTVCYWEQRGAGLSFNPDVPVKDITVALLIADAIEVTRYLRQRFGVDKIYLMGHSWGSLIGIQVAYAAPELFFSYMGVSQISNQRESEKIAYYKMIEEYTYAGNEHRVAELKQCRADESDEALFSYFRSQVRDKTMHELGIGTMRSMRSVITGIFHPFMRCKAYTMAEKINVWRAKHSLLMETKLVNELFATDLTKVVTTLEIPVYFLSGQYDYTVNHKLSKQYLDVLKAPRKGFYAFHNSAHCPMHEEPDRFIQIVVGEVLGQPSSSSIQESHSR